MYPFYSYQMGKLPVFPSKGDQYIIFICEICSGPIIIEPMRNKTSGHISKAYQVLVDLFKNCGVTPKRYIMDNDTLEQFKHATKKNIITAQLVPPYNHRINISEKVIQTFKIHLISVLCGLDENFPIHLSDRLLRQA